MGFVKNFVSVRHTYISIELSSESFSHNSYGDVSFQVVISGLRTVK